MKNCEIRISNFEVAGGAGWCAPASSQFEFRNSKFETGRGFVLIVVLVVVSLLSLLAVTQMLITRSESAASVASVGGQQARAAAYSGIVRAMALLKQSPNDLAGRSDNPQVFQDQCVSGSGADGWYFSVYSPNPDDSRQVRYGVEDENGKFNLNLYALVPATPPGMLTALLPDRPDLVDCLLDYLDADSNARPQGAEQEYYDGLPQPYHIKNGPLTSVDELLLVKGFTGQIVYGEDANRNGTLEPNEDDGDASFPPDNGDGELDCGLVACTTTLSYEPNTDFAGQGRININTPISASDLQSLNNDFPPETAKFLAARRAVNRPFKDVSELLDLQENLVDPSDTNPQTKGKPIPLASGITASNLAKALDRLTTGGVKIAGQEMLLGRVNVNSAPAKVLAAIFGDAQAAQKAIDERAGLSADEAQTPAWLLTHQVMASSGAFKVVGPYITARSFQFRLRSMGYNPASGRYCVLEAVIDTAGPTARVVYLRDLTGLGVPLVPPGREKS